LPVELAWFLVPVAAVAIVFWKVHSGGPYADAEALRARIRSGSAFTLLATSFAGFLYYSVRLFARVVRGELFRIPTDPGQALNLRGELIPLVAILGTLLILWIILQLS
jgi:hypothetical protein